jgi:hypothetical protein
MTNKTQAHALLKHYGIEATTYKQQYDNGIFCMTYIAHFKAITHMHATLLGTIAWICLIEAMHVICIPYYRSTAKQFKQSCEVPLLVKNVSNWVLQVYITSQYKNHIEFVKGVATP